MMMYDDGMMMNDDDDEMISAQVSHTGLLGRWIAYGMINKVLLIPEEIWQLGREDATPS